VDSATSITVQQLRQDRRGHRWLPGRYCRWRGQHHRPSWGLQVPVETDQRRQPTLASHKCSARTLRTENQREAGETPTEVPLQRESGARWTVAGSL